MKTKIDIERLISSNELDGDLTDIYEALVGDFGLMEGEKMAYKTYFTECEVYDDAETCVAKVKAFDEETFEVEIKGELFATGEDFRKFAEVIGSVIDKMKNPAGYEL